MRTSLLGILLALPFLMNAQLQSPETFLGYELGTQFTRHHEVVAYYRHIAESLPKQVQFSSYGQTNERRPLMLAIFSTEENMANLESIRKTHLESTQGAGAADKAIVWLSYNVHGNESVSTEASMQTIYELLTEKKAYLEDTIIIMDPCINPDGRDRYVNWYNQYKNTPYQVDPMSKEHNEGWWSGRSNHYMFDLNRDWAWLTQVESQQRLKVFNQWLPHVHVDFHEQGVNSPYYFAPAAEPYHEVITDFQRDFQETIGRNHAKYFDANGWFYFTKERFDLLYPSYGDTYPTYNGGIGMTYEQGGSGRAGLGIITAVGDTLTLKDRIAHHFTTGISTVEVASKNVAKLNNEFQKFYQNKDYRYKSYVVKGGPDKLNALRKLLDQHEIKYGGAPSGTVKGYDYKKGSTGSMRTSTRDLVVPTDQTRGTLVKVLFEPKAKLSDSVTYDITAWSLPYAYGLDAIASTTAVTAMPLEPSDSMAPLTMATTDHYAYIGDWDALDDAKFLAYLLNKGVRVRFTHKPFTLEGKRYDRGSLIITASDNAANKGFTAILNEAIKKYNKGLTPVSTGFVDNGKDFGSNSVQMVPDTKIAVLMGEPTSTLRYGEIWHFFEQQLEYPISALDASYFERVDISKYDALILPDGWGYRSFMKESVKKKIKAWVRAGGRLIAMGNAIDALAKDKGFPITAKKKKVDSTAKIGSYAMTERERIKSAITGAIFKTTVDPTHPLAYGYDTDYFSLKLGDKAFDYLENGSAVYLKKGQEQPVSGFAGSQAIPNIAESLIFGSHAMGRGQVIYMVDNPLFRGFWENGKLFFANALFMVH